MTCIAYLGPKATFSEQAVDEYLRQTNVGFYKKPCFSFNDVFNCFLTQSDCLAMVPLENSIEGGVGICSDHLAQLSDVYIIAEQYLAIHHCLMSHQLVSVKDITHIYSHPQPLGQCRDYLEKYCKASQLIETASTAAAADILTGRGSHEIAAMIGSFSLASLHGLHILQENIQDLENNQTRFVLLSKKPDLIQANRYKTSLILAMDKNIPGSLYDILAQFNQFNINLTRIESRPFKREMGEYLFYIDFEGHNHQGHVSKCLSNIEKKVYFFKNLGSYAFQDPIK